MVLEGEKCLNRRYIRAIYTICRIHATVVWDLRQCSVLPLYIVIAPLWLSKHCLTWKKCRGYYRVQSDILLMYNTHICTQILRSITEYNLKSPLYTYIYTQTCTSHASIHWNIHTDKYMCAHNYIPHIYIYLQFYSTYTHLCAHKYSPAYMHIHIHTQIHMNMCIHIYNKHMCAHAWAHTCT